MSIKSYYPIEDIRAGKARLFQNKNDYRIRFLWKQCNESKFAETRMPEL